MMKVFSLLNELDKFLKQVFSFKFYLPSNVSDKTCTMSLISNENVLIWDGLMICTLPTNKY